jgi:hypothetical protein
LGANPGFPRKSGKDLRKSDIQFYQLTSERKKNPFTQPSFCIKDLLKVVLQLAVQ